MTDLAKLTTVQLLHRLNIKEQALIDTSIRRDRASAERDTVDLELRDIKGEIERRLNDA